jgi:hypothetical protein
MSSATPSPLLIETKPEGLAPNEERLAAALSAVINASDVDGTEAMRVMRRVSENIALPKLTPDAAFERLLLRSLGADSELREAEGGGLSDAEFWPMLDRLGVRMTSMPQEKEKSRGWTSAAQHRENHGH